MRRGAHGVHRDIPTQRADRLSLSKLKDFHTTMPPMQRNRQTHAARGVERRTNDFLCMGCGDT
jgi:hypothetical protein